MVTVDLKVGEAAVASEDRRHGPPIEIYFFPFVGGGHQIPMLDLARLFSTIPSVHATVLTTSSHHPLPPLPASIAVLYLSDVYLDTSLSALPVTDTSHLAEPLRNLLVDRSPDCIVVDGFHRWSPAVIGPLGVPRIAFSGNGSFAQAVRDAIQRTGVAYAASDDYEEFVVPDIPDKILMTRSQLPPYQRRPLNPGEEKGMVWPHDFMEGCFGVLINSFFDLEGSYVEYFRKKMGRSWVVGPVSLCNEAMEDKLGRGKKADIDRVSCLSWLDGKGEKEVIYVSFGSLARMSMSQLVEIAHGLESSGCSFIWVIGNVRAEERGEDWMPAGFEERIARTGKGLLIRGWAPQLVILEHPSVGGFLTHCGWNSTLEGVTAGVPMVTFPITAEQFFNEKLVTDVLGIGVKVGSRDWSSWSTEAKEPVGREKIERAVRRVMRGGGEQADEMRKRAGELARKAREAVEEGGSSWEDARGLVAELHDRRKLRARVSSMIVQGD
ncbi:hypothetical protein MLD38_026977 [Melastoma candidum]|uniref:Uncharacterized protein n=1 Tax=Melastoma candidum TaxID=119954 RepID=A0ACB9P3N8_9MYRT|nr:hypothetical protein MLD38_026977 [Melastoma candidum]